MRRGGRQQRARRQVAPVAPAAARTGPRPDPEQVLVIGCGMLAREILAIKERLGLSHLVLQCLPAELHFQAQRIPAAVDSAIERAKAEGYQHIFVGYADCGTGGMLDTVLEKHGVERLAGPHCFAVYQGAAAFAQVADDDVTSFYMTDFLCRQFDAFFMRPLGLDRYPDLAKDYFGNYEKLVYLAQTDDAELEAVAQKAAVMLDLTYEKRVTYYGDFVPVLARVAEKRPEA